MFRNGRSARGESPETEGRFLANPGQIGPKTTNWGSAASLSGLQAGATAKLLKISDVPGAPFIVSVATLYSGSGGITPTAGVSVKGTFGSGGGTCSVEFDAKPDITVQLPGQAIDLDIVWSTSFVGSAGNVVTEAVNLQLLPGRADVSAVACKGEQSRGSATKTQGFSAIPAGQYILTCPRFADEFMWYGDTAAAYVNLTQIDFLTTNDPAVAQILASYTSAQILAIRNAGMKIPVPGIASAIRITTTAVVNGFATYFLSL